MTIPVQAFHPSRRQPSLLPTLTPAVLYCTTSTHLRHGWPITTTVLHSHITLRMKIPGGLRRHRGTLFRPVGRVTLSSNSSRTPFVAAPKSNPRSHNSALGLVERCIATTPRLCSTHALLPQFRLLFPAWPLFAHA